MVDIIQKQIVADVSNSPVKTKLYTTFREVETLSSFIKCLSLLINKYDILWR